MISAFLAVTSPIVYAYVNESLLSDILFNPFYCLNVCLSILYFYERLKPYLQKRYLRINTLGLVCCFLLYRFIEDMEISANLLCIGFNLCAYFNEILGCLGMEEEEY